LEHAKATFIEAKKDSMRPLPQEVRRNELKKWTLP